MMSTAGAGCASSALQDLVGLYAKYDAELRRVARTLRTQYHLIQRRSYSAAFGDVEGELLYLMVRETRPSLVVEISPNAGWSTNYILAALSHNAHGVLHSFEIIRRFRMTPSEQVIRRNQHPAWDQRRLVVHIGDARDLLPTVDGPIGCLLIDSCHEEWFAKWYVSTVFPRVVGPVMIQDVAFVDYLEPSTEAGYVWAWCRDRGVQLTLVGAMEETLARSGLRAGMSERRSIRSNAVLFTLPPVEGTVHELRSGPRESLAQGFEALSAGAVERADEYLTRTVQVLLSEPCRENRHRYLFRAGQGYAQLGLFAEAHRCFERALGVAVLADRQDRAKGFAELTLLFVWHGQWRLMLSTLSLIMLEPGNWLQVLWAATQISKRST